jgi:inorganic pyrophosphatase
MRIDVTVEVPAGSRNKYELDQTSGRIRLDRTLFTATCYPCDYGFVEHTLGRDGSDPLDALVLSLEPTFPGCLIQCRPVALLCTTDEAGQDNKAVCVPTDDPRYEHLVDVTDLAASTKSRIEHFFRIYKQLEPGKSVASDMSWARRATAETEIRTARDRARPRHA